VSVNTVAKLMAEQRLVAQQTRRRHGTTKSDKSKRKAPDLLGRDFTPPPRPNVVWVEDLTEIPTGEGKLQLAAIIDLHSRRVPGFAMDVHYDPALARAALCMVIAVRSGLVSEVISTPTKAVSTPVSYSRGGGPGENSGGVPGYRVREPNGTWRLGGKKATSGARAVCSGRASRHPTPVREGTHLSRRRLPKKPGKPCSGVAKKPRTPRSSVGTPNALSAPATTTTSAAKHWHGLRWPH
jgi:hypothetical protein